MNQETQTKSKFSDALTDLDKYPGLEDHLNKIAPQNEREALIFSIAWKTATDIKNRKDTKPKLDSLTYWDRDFEGQRKHFQEKVDDDQKDFGAWWDIARETPQGISYTMSSYTEPGLYSHGYFSHIPEVASHDAHSITSLEIPLIIESERIQTRIIKEYTDMRYIWRWASVWFDGEPVMLIQNAGREGDDSAHRFIDPDHYGNLKAMVEFISDHLAEDSDVAKMPGSFEEWSKLNWADTSIVDPDIYHKWLNLYNESIYYCDVKIY